MEIYLRLAARETFQCRDRIKRVRDRLKGQMTDCEFRSDEDVKQLIEESRWHFRLDPLTFNVSKAIKESDEAEFKGIIPEAEIILTDSSLNTSDDDDLLQEVEKFGKNLEKWFAQKERRIAREAARRARELKRKTERVVPSPAKIGKCDDKEL